MPPPTHITLHRATPADAPALAVLAAQTFRDTYAEFNTPEDMDSYIHQHFTPERIAQEIDDPLNMLFCALCDDALAGYIKLSLNPVPYIPGTPALEIARFYVDRRFQGKGVGKKLMETVMEQALQLGLNSIWLGVWQKNLRAIAIYRHLGFEVAGTTTFQLGGDLQEDFIMVKHL